MKADNQAIRRMMRRSFFDGMASIFCPSMLRVDYLPAAKRQVGSNKLIVKSWQEVGAAISIAYGKEYSTTLKDRP